LAARLQGHLAELRDIERKLPELRTKSANLITTTDRLQRELEADGAALENLRRALELRAEAARKAVEASDEAVSAHARLFADVERRRQAASDLASIPEEDSTKLESDLADARKEHFRAEQLHADRASALEKAVKLISDLESGIRRYPTEIQNTLEALAQAGIKASLVAERVEILSASWTTAIESALGNLRYAICVDASDERQATVTARGHGFLGPIVSNAELRTEPVSAGPLQFTDSIPGWLIRWANELRLCDSNELAVRGPGIAQDGTRRDTYGIWVSQAPDRVLGGGAIRHQLEQARRDHERITNELATTEEAVRTGVTRVSQFETRLARQRRRNELLEDVAVLPELEGDLAIASASCHKQKQERDQTAYARAAAERAVIDAEVLLKQKKQELGDRVNELNGTRTAVAEMEQKRNTLEPEIEEVKAQLEPPLVHQAEVEELPSVAMAERDLVRAQNALADFEREGEIPDATVRGSGLSSDAISMI